jgi:hypothetical protein
MVIVVPKASSIEALKQMGIVESVCRFKLNGKALPAQHCGRVICELFLNLGAHRERKEEINSLERSKARTKEEGC